MIVHCILKNKEAYDFTLEDEVIAYEESSKLKEALYKLQDMDTLFLFVIK
ncbi:hypothetical protein [Clostridium sp. AWRP]|nr:hypothetical protein [Clostridium sp. AWRP]